MSLAGSTDAGAARLGVCSWSLRADKPENLPALVRACGVDRVQLALEPLRSGAWDFARTEAALREAGVSVASAMMETAGEDYSTIESIRETGGVRPDRTWRENLQRAQQNAILARRLGAGLVTLHAGFIPADHRSGEHRVMVTRLREVARLFQAQGVRVALETGQESADHLRRVLDDIGEPEVSVNFDPANMLLYGTGDPVAALKKLVDRVAQVHVKDAIPPRAPGEWGTEVRAGDGRVDWPEFFAALAAKGFSGGLMIEREAGDSRVPDAAHAVEMVKRLLREEAAR